MAAAKKKAHVASKTSATSASALKHNSGVCSEAQTSCKLPQPKRKAEELSSSDCPYESTSYCPVTGHLFNDRPMAPQTNKLPRAAIKLVQPRVGLHMPWW
jgi:hypothetical protein